MPEKQRMSDVIQRLERNTSHYFNYNKSTHTYLEQCWIDSQCPVEILNTFALLQPHLGQASVVECLNPDKKKEM